MTRDQLAAVLGSLGALVLDGVGLAAWRAACRTADPDTAPSRGRGTYSTGTPTPRPRTQR